MGLLCLFGSLWLESYNFVDRNLHINICRLKLAFLDFFVKSTEQGVWPGKLVFPVFSLVESIRHTAAPREVSSGW